MLRRTESHYFRIPTVFVRSPAQSCFLSSADYSRIVHNARVSYAVVPRRRRNIPCDRLRKYAKPTPNVIVSSNVVRTSTRIINAYRYSVNIDTSSAMITRGRQITFLSSSKNGIRSEACCDRNHTRILKNKKYYSVQILVCFAYCHIIVKSFRKQRTRRKLLSMTNGTYIGVVVFRAILYRIVVFSYGILLLFVLLLFILCEPIAIN